MAEETAQATRVNYPEYATVNITFNPSTKEITVAPRSRKVKAGGTLRWNCTGNVASFEVAMKNGSRTPFVDGKTRCGGKTAVAEPVDPNAASGPSDPDNTYSYSVTCTDQNGEEHTLDPDVVVGPPT